MAKALKEAAKPKKLIPDAYLFFFIAIVLNYVWRMLDNVFMYVRSLNEAEPVLRVIGGGLLGWTPFDIIAILVWLLSLYSLYILYVMVKKKERFLWSLALLILGVLFYLVTIFY
ncbi:MAG: hypothetical protein KJ955_08640 [Nanoarchaeota archaeon]|nr:hypothetical protein [Nanoarchaeota archaeon]